jgi:leukotriene-A4 hydrolase
MRRILAGLPLLLLLACGRNAERVATPESAKPAARPQVDFVVRDPHSYSNPGEARVEHLVLDLSVDFAKKQLSGTAEVRFRNVSGTKTLVLDTNGLTIRRVLLLPGGMEAKYDLRSADPVFGSPLRIAIEPATTAVSIEYSSSPGAKALQWLEPSMTAGKKHPFLLSQSQSILARTWVPLQDTPQVRFTYEATLRVPKELLAVMSAENPQSRSADGIYRFRMPQSVPSYLMAIAVGDLEFRPFDDRSGVYAEPGVVEAAHSEFRDTPKLIAAAEELYGPYRWGRYDVLVLPPSFPFGGMENPRLTFLTPTVIAGDRSLVSLISHELAHSWSGNLVTNATWSDGWINEGVTTYIENRITEKVYGRDYAEMIWLLGVTEAKEEIASTPPADQALYVDMTGRDPDDAPYLAYQKGALFLRLLEETAGRARWDAFLRGYFDAFAFQPMTTDRFVAYLNQQLPDVAKKAAIDAWIHGPGLPANAPKPQSTAFARVEAQARAFAGGAPAASLQTAGWSSHEWVHFIDSLPLLYPERMESLDAQFHFRDSGNNEVLSAWLEKSLDTGYKDVYPAVERFLTIQGRRKYVEPIFRRLAKSDPAFAKRVYAKARPTYHPLTQGSIDALLGR